MAANDDAPNAQAIAIHNLYRSDPAKVRVIDQEQSWQELNWGECSDNGTE